MKARPIFGFVLVMLVVLAPTVFANEQAYMHNIDQGLMDLENPIGTVWHELYPVYCREPWILTSWIDNGDSILSPCDCIDMTFEGDIYWFHVDEVTVTLCVTETEFPTFQDSVMYLDFLGGFEEYNVPITNPVGTLWHEIYPAFCEGPYQILAWFDNGDGEVNYCDTLVISGVYLDPYPFHVEDIATDIILTPEGGPSALRGSTWGNIKALYK